MKYIGTKKLETERLILRKVVLNDAEQLFYNWGSDVKMNEYLSFKVHESIDDTLKMVNYWINDYDKNGYHWIIEIKNTNEVIGLISGSYDTIKFNYIEIGYSCGSKFWNNGYITEAVNRVIKYFIDECDFNIVETRIPSKNISSIKVAEKCNMKKEAVLKNRYINKITNDVNDILIYSITKEEY